MYPGTEMACNLHLLIILKVNQYHTRGTLFNRSRSFQRNSFLFRTAKRYNYYIYYMRPLDMMTEPNDFLQTLKYQKISGNGKRFEFLALTRITVSPCIASVTQWCIYLISPHLKNHHFDPPPPPPPMKKNSQ